MKPARSRQSLRQTLTDNQKAMDGIARLMGKPTVSLGVIPNAPKPRAKSVPDGALEHDVQKAVMQYLGMRHDVVIFGRFNRGTMPSSYIDGSGVLRKSFTRFNTIPGFPDIHGMLVGGRAFYIEVKRERGGTTSDEQTAFISGVLAGGGIAGIVRSVDEVIALLP